MERVPFLLLLWPEAAALLLGRQVVVMVVVVLRAFSKIDKRVNLYIERESLWRYLHCCSLLLHLSVPFVCYVQVLDFGVSWSIF
jgi:hypothetical protein